MSQKIQFDGEIITSRQNRRIVELMKLDDRRTREQTRLFRFDGVKLLCEAMGRGVTLDKIFLRVGTAEKVESRMQELYGCTLAQVGCPVFGVEDGLFEKISQENAPDGVITVAKYIDKSHNFNIIYKEDDLTARKDAPILLLESVRDPLNVGAIIRSAAALGVGRLIMSADCADLYHPRTLRAAMGPLFSMPVTRVEDLPAYEALDGYRNAEYFATKALLVVVDTVTSGSVKVSIDSVGNGTVTLAKEMSGDVGTADMATWLLWAEVDQGLTENWSITNPGVQSNLSKY